MEFLLNLDKALFRIINGRWHHPLLDAVLPLVREKSTWLPLYLFLFVFLLVNFRRGGWVIGYTIATAVLTDLISSAVIKKLVLRLRPCRDPEVLDQLRMLAPYCGGNSSFTSSHAANHFGVATFLFLVLRPFIGRWAYALPVWAATICYAQVYVGVHFPLDVTAGALLGVLSGWGMYRLFANQPGVLTTDDLRTPS